MKKRLEILDELGHQLFGRVRLIRDALVCLLVTVLLMLGCSLDLGVAPFLPSLAWAAPGLFVGGVVVMIVGVFRAIQELACALETLTFEHETLERFQHENGGAFPENGS